ncbi:MAG: cell division protein ZapA [Flavobacteriaceae bacterium]|nr:MAG: cell division protein ZapA [Flavobacteriaceae bacterium]
MSAVKIKINIGGRMYPLTVQSEEETTLRAAGKKINQMIKQFEEKYQIQDKQDVLSMCALQIAAKLEMLESAESGQNAELTQAFEELEQMLS